MVGIASGASSRANDWFKAVTPISQVARLLGRTLLFDDVHLTEAAGQKALELFRPFFESVLQKQHAGSHPLKQLATGNPASWNPFK
jgi:hypothetical protein